MPFIAAPLAAAFAAVPVVGAALSSGILALGFTTAAGGFVGMAGLGASLSAWGTAFALGSAAITMTQKVPKPPSASIQLDTKIDANPPRTVAFGRTAVAGSVVYQSVSGVKQPNDNIRLSRIIALSQGPIHSVESFWVGDKQLTFSNSGLYSLAECVGVSDTEPDSKLWRTNYRQGYSLGQTPEPAAPPIYTGTAMKGLSASSKLSGIAHVTQHLDFLAENFPTGDPKNAGYRFVGKWTLHYDPRKDSTYPGGSGSHRLDDETTYEWTENPAIIALNVTLGRYENGKKVWGLGAPAETIDVAAFVNAANVADANDWHCGGEFATTDEPYQVISAILQTCSAYPTNNSGLLSCFVNAPIASVLTLDGNDVVGSVEVSTSTAWRDRKNRVLPFYRAESQRWEIISGEPVSGSTYLAEDGGETKTIEVKYPYCNDATQAHQLGTYELVNTREFLQFTVKCSPRLAMAARVGDCLTLDLPEVAAPNQKCVVVSADIDPQTWEIMLVLRSETDAKHAFALGQTSEAPPSPGLSGDYDPSNPNPPVAGEYPDWFILDNRIVENNVVFPALVIGGACDDLNAESVIVDYREDGVEEWTNHATVPVQRANGVGVPMRFEIKGLKPRTAYQSSVSYWTNYGVQSARLLLPTTITADLSIPAENIDFWYALGSNSIAEFGQFVRDTANTIAESNVVTLVEDIDLLGQTQIENKLQDIRNREMFETLTYTNGVTVVNAITFVQNDISEIVDGQNAMVEVIDAIGAYNANSGAFRMRIDNVTVDDNGTSLASTFTAIVAEGRDGTNAAILEERMARQAADEAQANATLQLSVDLGEQIAAGILSEQNARVTADNALASDLSLLMTKTPDGTAAILRKDFVYIDNSTTLSNAIVALQAASNGANAAVLDLKTAQAANNAAFASSISSVSATAGSAASTASTALSASTTAGSRWGVTLNTDGYVTGLLLNNGGASKSNFTIMTDSLVVAAPGMSPRQMLLWSGGTLKLQNIEVDTIKANIITTNHLVGAAVSALDSSDNGGVSSLNPSETTHHSFGFTSTGGAHLVDVYGEIATSTNNAAGAVIKVYCDGSLIQVGSIYCPGSWGGVGLSMPARHIPGAGYHTYSVTYTRTSGSGTSSVNRTSIRVTELKR